MVTSDDHDRSTSAALRREYGDAGLDPPDLAPDPVAMFRRWLDDTVAAGLHEPNAVVVSTVSAEGHPSSRMVLLKGLDERGSSSTPTTTRARGTTSTRPGTCALLFPWHDLQRQVRVEGTCRAGLRRGERGLLRLPAARLAARRLGLAAVRARSRREPSSTPATTSPSAGSTADEVPLPPRWGGFRVHARDGGVLAGTPRPDARPAGLPPNRGWVDHRAAGSLSGHAARDRSPARARLVGRVRRPGRCAP